ncbi:MAG TPA: sucrase ferredoxin [Anaerolineales bacterium]|nr:sucrase ferredoxin [Anaerolineales bacterium]
MTSPEKFFCSHHAQKQDVPIIGSGTHGDVWFLLEYPNSWGAKAFKESSLPQAVKDHLSGAAHPEGDLRIQMIRQPQSRYREGVRFFAAQTHLSPPRMYEYHLSGYEDLLAIDLKALAAGEEGDLAHLRTEPLFVVCTNGKRDQCCALYGPEVYQAMADVAGDAVWQSSHIGGHNMAPVSLYFPHGVHYSRTKPEDIGGVIEAYRQGQVSLPFYRGRVSLPQFVQAAEYFWREKTGVLDLDVVQLGAVKELGEKDWLVEIRIKGEAKQRVHLRQTISDYEIPITCKQTKTAPIRTFQLMDL